MTPERILADKLKSINSQICCINNKLQDLDEVIFFSHIGTSGLPSLAVPGLSGKLYVNIDTGESFIANPTGLAPYYTRVSRGMTDEYIVDFTKGTLTETLYLPALKIVSIENILNIPGITITVAGLPYSLLDDIAKGVEIVITVSTASVIQLNLLYKNL